MRSSRLRSVAALAAAALITLPGSAALAASPHVPTAPAAVADAPPEIGYVGWDTYRHLDELWQMTTGVESKQFSSFDRTGANWQDGFDGTYSCLRQTAQGCVIAEDSGAGEVQSIWFTRDGGDVSNTGNIIVELDGVMVLNAPLQAVVNGEVGAPFVYPFVANADQSSGGVTIKVPMPYREHMTVTTTSNPLFHHVSYRTFASSDGISTFDPADVPADVMAAAATWGTVDPKPAAAGTETSADTSVAPGETVVLADLQGSGYIDEIGLTIPQIVGAPATEVVQDDGRAFTGYSEFDIAIDPNNEGVILTRRYDSFSTYQTADLYVDGVLAGQWTGGPPTPGIWIEESVLIPAEFTAGRDTIRIRNDFVSASIDYSEFSYWADSLVGGAEVRTDELDVGPWPDSLASESAHNYVITGQGWEGDRVNTRPLDVSEEEAAQIAASDAVLSGLRLQVVVDGQTTVDSPVGEFFGSGLGEAAVTALMYRMDPEGEYTSWWAMPHASTAQVRLVNGSDVPVEAVTSRVVNVDDPTVAEGLTAEYPSIGYFHATSRTGDTVDGQDWNFLDVDAQGRFLGVNQTMRAYLTEGNVRGYLEGDERFYVDELRTPQWHGTGTEDFYEAGWYFNRGAFSNPMNGAPLAEAAGFGCDTQCDTAYRLLIGDAIDFGGGIVAGIEHGGWDTDPAAYSSTAFWYGHDGEPTLFRTDGLDVGNAASESIHGYVGGGAVTTLNSTFEGDHDDETVSENLRATSDEVSFNVSVDPANAGVVLQRMSDQNTAYQSADVYVDGTLAGTWMQPLHNTTHRWLEDSFVLSRTLTAGKSDLTIRLVPSPGSAPWTAASYTVRSHVDELTPHSFTDVPPTYPFVDEISWMYEQQISVGWDNGDGTRRYQPLSPTNRDAMAAFMFRLAARHDSSVGTYEPPPSSPYYDVSRDDGFYREIAWMFDAGISTGWMHADGTRWYEPLSPTNRDAMAAFMFRLAARLDPAVEGYVAPAVSPFTDVSTSHPFYREIAWMSEAGISTGWDNGDGTRRYQPLSPTTRDAMAAFMYRLDAYLGD